MKRLESLTKHIVIVASLVLALAAPAWADPLAIAKAHDDAFDAATWKGGCDPQKGLTFYDKGAIAVYPGQGEESDTKAGIEKLIKSFIAPYCGEGHKPPKIVNYQIRAIGLGPDYVMIVRSGDVGEGNDLTHVRATELIHKSGGKWRYLVDHASIGVPPSAAATTSKK
ncbi:MAG TPA: hypothetical protein VKS22_12710 [Candidatus Binataceae bacterium]|nr:hypothetical protein [Candidatus Binataceae bacterium]